MEKIGKICVIGIDGQLARSLSVHQNVKCFGRKKIDLLDGDKTISFAENVDASVVVNAAGYTSVDRAETEPLIAHEVNANSVGAIAKIFAKRKIPLIHVSTDYVFDGKSDRPYTETDFPVPMNVYGETKLASERFVEEAGGSYAIIRSSGIFSEFGSNFVANMLRISVEENTLNVVSDQKFDPTPASALATAIITISSQLVANPEKSGIFHFSGKPTTNWADFARHIFEISGTKLNVNNISLDEWPGDAIRPLNTSLCCKKIERTFGITQCLWVNELKRVVIALKDRCQKVV